MCATTIRLSADPLSIGCYRQRIAYYNGEICFSTKNNVRIGSETFIDKYPVYDMKTFKDSLVFINGNGTVHQYKNGSVQENPNVGHPGIFAGITLTESYIIAAHDLSHKLRVIDGISFETISTIPVPGLFHGLATVKADTIAAIDDRTISIIDTRDPSSIERSSVISSQPVTIFCHDSNLYVACDDRKLRIYDMRRLKTPLTTTKPASKNGTAALWTNDGKNIVSVGTDESMTLVELEKDIGQFKRSKYLAESPWISSPLAIDNDFACLTRGGFMHKFNNIVSFLKSQQESNEDDE